MHNSPIDMSQETINKNDRNTLDIEERDDSKNTLLYKATQDLQKD